MNNTNKNLFSFSEYNQILSGLKNRFVNFPDAINKKEFIILRHDVEFTISRALDLAKIELEHSIKSTFFFQVISDAYNPFSKPEPLIGIILDFSGTTGSSTGKSSSPRGILLVLCRGDMTACKIKFLK